MNAMESILACGGACVSEKMRCVAVLVEQVTNGGEKVNAREVGRKYPFDSLQCP